MAAQCTSAADELDRQRRNSSVKRWVDKITGMHHTHLELDPIRDAQLWSIVNAQLSDNVQNDGNAQTPLDADAGRCLHFRRNRRNPSL